MAVRYVRRGECSHCGWCCQFLGKFELSMPPGEVDEEFKKVRGFRNDMIRGDFLAPCPQHVNNRCAVYDTRPSTCRDFPSEPNQIIGTPCSYWFEEVRDEP